MEESKIKEAKEKAPEKMSYEQLENIAHQLSEQSKALYERLQKAEAMNFFNRLEFLIKVADSGIKFSEGFKEKCIKEIEDMMSLDAKVGDSKDEESK